MTESLITTETSIICPHGSVKPRCPKCEPPKRVGGDVSLEVDDGLLFIARGCRWRGQFVWHDVDDCKCRNIPEHYVQLKRDAPSESWVAWTADVVAMPRGARSMPAAMPTKRGQLRKPVMLFMFQCRHCWPNVRRFKSEDGANEHLKSVHDVTPHNRITEALHNE